MLFNDIIGQALIKKGLVNMVNGKKVGHALLFTGKEGSGSLPLAIAFARYLNCESRQSGDSCNQCRSCRKFGKLAHPDLHFVFPVASRKASEKNPVSDDLIKEWRAQVLDNPYMSLFQWYENLGIENKQGAINKAEGNQIIKKLSFKNFEAQYKVMIIWMAEKMNVFVANQLLKILEEPPPDTIFILVATDTGPILPTVLSRSQIVKIPKIEKQDMENALAEKHNMDDPQRIEGLVRIADGNYLQLLEALRHSEETEYHLTMFVNLMRLCYSVDIQSISSWIDEMSARGREMQKQFLQYALRMIRGNFIINIDAGGLDLLSKEERDFSMKFSKFIHPGNIFHICDELNKASVHIEYYGYSKLVFFDLALKIMKLLKR